MRNTSFRRRAGSSFQGSPRGVSAPGRHPDRRNVPAGTLRAFACPTCHAGVDEMCISGNGNRQPVPHRARRHLCMQKYLTDREANADLA